MWGLRAEEVAQPDGPVAGSSHAGAPRRGPLLSVMGYTLGARHRALHFGSHFIPQRPWS